MAKTTKEDTTKKTAKPAPKADAKKAEVKTEAKKPAPAPKKTAEVKKPATKKYHISQRKDDDMWQVKAEGAEKALKLFKTQAEAIDYAKKVADNQEGCILIHKKDGSFRKLTY